MSLTLQQNPTVPHRFQEALVFNPKDSNLIKILRFECLICRRCRKICSFFSRLLATAFTGGGKLHARQVFRGCTSPAAFRPHRGHVRWTSQEVELKSVNLTQFNTRLCLKLFCFFSVAAILKRFAPNVHVRLFHMDVVAADTDPNERCESLNQLRF